MFIPIVSVEFRLHVKKLNTYLIISVFYSEQG